MKAERCICDNLSYFISSFQNMWNNNIALGIGYFHSSSGNKPSSYRISRAALVTCADVAVIL